MIWLDGLDVPLVRYLRANFYEAYPEDQQPIVGVAESERKFASGALRPAWESTRSVDYSPAVALQMGQDLRGAATAGRG